MDKLVSEVAEILGIDKDIVETVINSYLRTLKKTISRIDYNSLSSFDGIKTNLAVPGLGKLIVNYKRKIKFNKHKIRKNGRDKESQSEITV